MCKDQGAKGMRVAIVGAGPAGGSLFRLLSKEYSVDLFDKEPEVECGCKSCGWGVNTLTFGAMCKYLGMDAREYYMRQFSKATVQGIRAKVGISLIDKPRFVRDLVGGSVKYGVPCSGYDRIIDATGRRVYLNHSLAENYFNTFQIKASMALGDIGLRVWLDPIMPSRILWVFPLEGNVVHIGILGLTSSPGYNDLKNSLSVCGLIHHIDKIVCQCQGTIWSGGIRAPFVEGKVFGVGETIGLVDPISGSGILPAMASARLLYENWENPMGYCGAIKERFGYIDSGARIMGALKHGTKPSLRDILAYSSERHMRGISLSVPLLIKLLLRNYKTSRGLVRALAM